MKRLYRNRLNALLLECFAEPKSTTPLKCLASLLTLLEQAEGGTKRRGISLARIQENAASSPADIRQAVERLAEPPGLVMIAADAEGGERLALAPPLEDVRAEVATMAESYLDAVAHFTRLSPPEDALERAFRQAQICFDLGLFFEAHEILEEQWRPLPPGSLRTFLQGLIQISVGFHHARHGNYAGTVNQLGKGLEKLSRTLAGFPDPAVEAFRQAVSELLGRVLSLGRERVIPLSAAAVPPFPEELHPAFCTKRGRISS